MTDSEWPRGVKCMDSSGRVRAIQVSISDDHHVIVAAPPGETGKLTLSDVSLLRYVLRAAQMEAADRGGMG